MFRTIDDLMYINDGHQPYQMLFIGRGGIGYTPTPYNMIGGMSMINPQFDENDDENIVPPVLYGVKIKYDKNTNNVINTDDEWLDENVFSDYRVIQENEKKIHSEDFDENTIKYIEKENNEKENNIKKNILDEIARLDDIKSTSNHKDNERYENKKIIDDIDRKRNELENLFYDIFKDKKVSFKNFENNSQSYKIKSKDDVAKVFNDYSLDKSHMSNIGYTKVYDEAKTIANKNPTYEKGNISEELLNTDQKLLFNVDGDYSKQYNSKDINAYTNDFKDMLEDLWGNAEYKEKFYKNMLKEKIPIDIQKEQWTFNDYLDYILQFFPVDIIKKNTIWELKNHENDITKTDNKQNYAKTKLEGFDPNKTTMIGYDILYKNINGKNRIYNIKAINNFNNKEVNTLPENDKGYNYYTFFYNNKKAGYYNALLDNNNFDFRPNRSPDDELVLDFDNMFINPDNYELVNDWKNKYKLLTPNEKKNFKILKKQIDEYEKLKNENIKRGTMNLTKDWRYFYIPTNQIYTYPSQIINDDKIINKFERKIKQYKKKVNK